LYRERGLEGAHVIKLGAGNDEAARKALGAWPGMSSYSLTPAAAAAAAAAAQEG